MVSDSELVERLQDFLQTSDLNTTTTTIVRRRLEEDFGVDLSEKKAFIREQVDLFLQSQAENEKEGEEEDVEEEAQEEEEDVDDVNVKTEGSGSDSEEEEEDGEDEASGRNRRSGKKKVSNKSNKETSKRGSGFTRLCSLSPQLQKFLGVSEMARTEVVKQLWVYIREKNLQDPGNRRNIICDEILRELFRVDSINMFQMNKVLSKHIWPLEDVLFQLLQPNQCQRKSRKNKEEMKVGKAFLFPKLMDTCLHFMVHWFSGSNEIVPKEKRRKGGTSGFLAPLPLSNALVKFFGTGENALSRADVVKRMWNYIKQNDLQDPADKRRVLCDDKLKELFEVDSFNGFTVPKLLASHFIKAEQ